MRFVDRLMLRRADESIRMRCPAKVNLFLKVLGRRSDGYHDVQTVMQTVTLFDELNVEKRDSGVSLTCSDRELAERPGENLAFKAAELFLQGGHGKGGVHLQLTKNIPVAAGLGGGSSDAGCCLLALNELFESAIPPERLRSLAAELGSDVPFFIEGGTALCTGRGELVRRLRSLPEFAGILAAPDVSLKTAEMYASLAPGDLRGPDVEATLRSIEEGDLKGVCSGLFNSFERSAFRRIPALAQLAKRLEGLGSMGTLLCGSGPTVLGIFRGPNEAESALARLRYEEGRKVPFMSAVQAL